ncbi:MAG: 3-phosphoshikimate 1-carboxyvinyltransferase [Candidatus Delongbacteria bacterium]|nr:3-phosphoshikimate 1-carboxyvinyltransferase [Candidatus Delongbacteria bacterium]
MSGDLVIKPGKISGAVDAYPSKSYIQRALVLGLLNREGIEILNYAKSSDSDAVLESIKSLGAKISREKDRLKVVGPEKFNNNEIYCNESGLCLRLFAPVLSLFEDERTIKGRASLIKRGNSEILSILEKFNVSYEVKGENITVRGPLKSGSILIENPFGSQIISGLLFALSLVEGDSIIRIKNPVSFPYIEMTADLLNRFGAYIRICGSSINITGGRRFRRGKVKIEGDWSSSAFFLIAGAVSGNVTVRNLNPESLQPDSAVIRYLESAGAEVVISGNSVSVKAGLLKGFDADITDHPDLFIPLVILGMNCEGVTRIFNYRRLKYKESNRPQAIVTELKKAGAGISVEKDCITVRKSRLEFAYLETHNDHRLAMGFAVAGILSDSGLALNDIDCVKKSHPDFFEDLNLVTERVK